MTAAVATRPQVAALCKPAARGVAATPVQRMDSPFGMANLQGRHLLQVYSCLMHGEIEPGDVIEVDMDVRRIRGGAIYLVRMVHADGAEWFGARRFDIQAGGIVGQDVDGEGWQLLPPEVLACIQVEGMVREVYRTRARWEEKR